MLGLTPNINTIVSLIVATKPADESVANSTILQDDDDLIISLEANTKYLINAVLFTENLGALQGIKFLLTGTVTFLSLKLVAQIYDLITDLIANGEVLLDLSTVVAATLSTGKSLTTFNGIIETDAEGSLKLQWAQNLSGASAAKILRGSYLSALKI